MFFKLWSKRKNQRKIFFCKEYYIWDCTHNIFNFNKYFVYHFPICFVNFARPIYEICMHKFHKRSCKISKTNRKMINKIFIKIENIVGLQKNIFPLILSLWLQLEEWWWRFLDFEDQSKTTSGLFLNELVEWWKMCVVVLFLFIKLAGRFDETFSFVVKLLFPYEVAFGFSTQDFPFWIFYLFLNSHSPCWNKTPLFIGEDREFEFQIPEF